MNKVLVLLLGAASVGLAAAANRPVQSAERIKQWRADVAVAENEFLMKDRSYSDGARAEAARRLERLAADVPTKTDQEIVAELARVAALADNGHTRAYLLRNRGWWRRFPIRIWHFADGWYVVAVKPGYEPLLGGRIERIADRPVAEAEAAVRTLYAGPRTWAEYMASYTLTSPDALLGTDFLHGNGNASFEVRKNATKIGMTVRPADEPKRTTPEESWWFLSPAHAQSRGWLQVLGNAPLPEYLAYPNRWYDLRRCDGNVLYLPFTRAEDQPGQPTLADFSRDTLQELAKSTDARLIIDLRFNTGGDLQKTRALFEEIARSPTGQTRGRLYVILGPSTFSAGITPAAILKASSRAVFVGTEPGDRLRFWAEGGNVTLPNSGITLHYADKAHLYAPGPPVEQNLVYLRIDANSLKPQISAYPRFAAYSAGHDPVMERIVPAGLRCAATKSQV